MNKEIKVTYDTEKDVNCLQIEIRNPDIVSTISWKGFYGINIHRMNLIDLQDLQGQLSCIIEQLIDMEINAK